MKTILITGGTDGIGKAAVKKLLDEGHKVATFSRSKDKCDVLKAELGADNDKLLVLQGDVTNTDSIMNVVSSTLEKFKTIDVLVNNAGYGKFWEADEFDVEEFKAMINTNLVGLAEMTKEVLPVMKDNKSGQIINISSIAGKRSFPQSEFYGATKFGVMGYSDGLRKEIAGQGIKVATVCPGMVKTSFFDADELERRMKKSSGHSPVFLAPEDVARTISLIVNQSAHSDIQDLTVMPF